MLDIIQVVRARMQTRPPLGRTEVEEAFWSVQNLSDPEMDTLEAVRALAGERYVSALLHGEAQ